MFKKLITAAVFALSASAVHAATCDVGSCSVIGADNQNLSDIVTFDINNIENDGGFFQFTAMFNNDSDTDAIAIAAFLDSASLGAISALVLEVTDPAAAGGFYNLLNDTPVVIDLSGAANSVISFTLTGMATPGTAGLNPDINLAILADDDQPPAVPLPAGALLMGTAIAGFGVARRRKKS